MKRGRNLALLWVPILMACASAAPPRQLSTAEAVTVTNDVRTFTAAVADGVTKRGPSAWRDYFAETPAFFMAVDGHIAFASSDEAARGIEAVAKAIPHIELHWGDVRIDPLTPGLAMVAAPYREVQVDAAGHQVTLEGYFTALAEREPGGWRFRNAHWSSAASPVH